MKFTLLLPAALAAFARQAPAQTTPTAAPDQLPTSKGPLTVQPITHGSVVFTWNGKTSYGDPYYYRGQNGLSDVAAFQKTMHAANQKIDVRLRNWYPAAQ